MAKIKTRKQWKKKCDDLWGKIVRSVGHCEVCGRPSGKLEAHHLITKGSSVRYRHDINNGICLCVRCHKFGGTVVDGVRVCAHGSGSVELSNNFVKWMEKHRPATFEWYQEHKEDKRHYESDYEAIYETLKELDTPKF